MYMKSNFNGIEMKKVILFASLIFVLFSCTQQKKPDVTAESRLNLANAYYTNGLYEASVQEYLKYLDVYHVEPERRANTYYTVANIYFERLNDYTKALEYYFKVKYLYPESQLQGEVGKRLVSCLERLDKSTDAQRIYEQDAALDKDAVEPNRPGAILAEIGERKITQGDLDFEIMRLPVYLHENFKEKSKKHELLQQMVLQELLYDSAKRKGLDQDKEVLDGAFRAKKSMMAEKILQQELQSKVKIEPQDVELYYLAHKDKYTETDEKGQQTRQKTLQEVRQQVAQDLAMERQQKAYQDYASRLMQAENVKIYEKRIR